MKKTGKLLQEKRESAGLTLSEVALATKINPKVLTAIESGDEAHLPAKTFLKGFVRSYALFLKLDVEEVLAVFQEEMGGPAPSAVAPQLGPDAVATPGAQQTARRRMNDENSSGMRTAAVVVIVLLIGLIIGVRELIEKYQREKVTVASEPEKDKATSPAPAEPSGDVTSNNNATAPTAPPAAATTPSVTTTEAPAKPEPKPEPKKKEDVKVAEPSPAAAAVTTPPKAEEPDQKSLAKAVKNEIILEALDNVEVKMKIKGETKRISLGPTQVHTVRSAEPVSFDFSDGGAVSIIVNGRERGPAGELGKPKQITIP